MSALYRFSRGGDWNFYDANNLEQSSDNQAVWAKTYEAVEVDENLISKKYSYKTGANGGYDVAEYPQSGDLEFVMPAVTGTYDFTFTLDTENWTLTYTSERVGGEAPEFKDIYFRGTVAGCDWYDNATDAEGIDSKWHASTSDGIVYTWDWSGDAVAFANGDQFKFGELIGSDWPSQGWGVAEGSSFAMNAPVSVAVPGYNFVVSSATGYSVTGIELNIAAMTVQFLGEGNVAESLYVIGAGTSAGWTLENALPMDKNGNTFTWTGHLSLSDEAFKILVSNTSWEPCYVASAEDVDLKLDTPISLVYRTSDQELDYKFKTSSAGTYTIVVELGENNAAVMTVSKIDDGDDPEPDPEVAPLWLYGTSFGTDFDDETYKLSPVDGIYTWTFDEALEVRGWLLVASSDWSVKYGSSEIISLPDGATSATINVQKDGNSANIAINGTLSVTGIELNTLTNELTVTGTESQEAGETLLYLRGDFNSWLNGQTPGDESISQWLGVSETEGVYVWDWSGISETEAKTLVGGFKIADLDWLVQYGPAQPAEIAIGDVLSVIDGNNALDATIAEPGIVVSKITLNTSAKTILIEGEPVEEPLEPSAEWSYVLNDDNTLTVTCTATGLAGQSDASSVIGLVGWIYPEDQPTVQYGRGVGTFTLTYTTEELSDGQTVSYYATWNWANGGVFTSEMFSYTFEEGEEPEPETVWYMAGDGTAENNWCCGFGWQADGCAMSDNGDGTWTYSTTLQAGTYLFKVTNGKWYDAVNTPDGINYGFNDIDVAASTSGYEDGGGNNVKFTVSAEADIKVIVNPTAEYGKNIILVSTVEFGAATIEWWTLVGAVPFFEGDGDWQFHEGNDLVQSSENEAVWSKKYEKVNVTKDDVSLTFSYKTGANGGYTVAQFPQSGDLTFTMPGEAAVYDITFTLDTENWTLDYITEKVGTASNVEETAGVQIYVSGGRIYVDAEEYSIYSLAGLNVTSQNGKLNGLYMVVTADTVVKVIAD